MDVTYSADIDHIDDAVREAAQEAPGEAIRVRLQPTILRRGKDNQQRAWAGVSWNLSCPTVDEAIALREGLRAFFDAVAEDGIGAVLARLQQT